MLAKDASHVTVGQVLRITEGSISTIRCLEDEINQCNRVQFCKTLPMWTGLNQVIADYLDSVTLQDMIEQYDENNTNDYMI